MNVLVPIAKLAVRKKCNNVDMLCASRHKVFRFIATSQAVFARTPNCQSRTVRTKGGTGFYADAIRRDERLLKRLEAQLTNVQAKIKRDEAEALELMKKHHGSKAGLEGRHDVDDHSFYFWEKVLTAEDRRDLMSYGIRSLDELYATHEAAEETMTRPPYPKAEHLEPRLRFAHQMYKSIPERISNDALTKARSPLRGWL